MKLHLDKMLTVIMVKMGNLINIIIVMKGWDCKECLKTFFLDLSVFRGLKSVNIIIILIHMVFLWLWPLVLIYKVIILGCQNNLTIFVIKKNCFFCLLIHS